MPDERPDRVAMATTVAIASFVDEGLGNSSYLVDLGDGRAFVLDPPRDVRPFRRLAEQRGLSLAFSVETHLHADFVSGSRELGAIGATIVAPRAAGLDFGHRGLADGEELDLGGLRLRALGTPGHTPEHLSYLLLDGSRPVGLFSGGALLPGSVARTDLISPERTEELARALYRALHERILGLPDELPVYPTHGAGSFCSTAAAGSRTTTIGRERLANPLLGAPDEETFVARLLGTLGSYPTYFGSLREVNRRGPRVYGEYPELERFGVAELERRIGAGAELIDVRAIERYAAGHIPRSLSIALRPAFASWLGWLVPADRGLVFVLDDGQSRAELVRQALGIGYERLEGELDGGIDAWRAAGRPVLVTGLAGALEAGPGSAPIIDVRQASEFVAGHVPGAIHLELGSFAGSGVEAVPPGATIMCGAGSRAMTAASLAERAGRPAVVFRRSADDWARTSGRALDRDR